MPRYDSASWEPYGRLDRLPNTRKTQLTIHITAGEGDPRSITTWRNGQAGSHFLNFRDGRLVQLADTSRRSAADAGATHTISVECIGLNGPLTPAQIASLKALILDAHKYDGVPLRLAQTSSDAGIGWHRLGVEGNFPQGRYGGRMQRSPLGVRTSNAYGKACPTDPVIDQIYDIIGPWITNIQTIKSDRAKRKVMDDMLVIYRAGKERTPYGVLAHNGGFVELSTKEEYDNLKRAGAKEIWIERKTLDNLIADVRA